MSAVTIKTLPAMVELKNATFGDLRSARARPGIWITIVIWSLQMLLFGYIASFLITTNAEVSAQIPPETMATLREGLLPNEAAHQVLSSIPGFGIPVGVVLGVLLVGVDYNNRTLGVILGRLSRRWVLLVSRFISIAVYSGIMVIVSVIVSLAAAICISLSSGDIGRIDVGALLLGTGCTWLSMFSVACLGACLTYVFQSTTPALFVGIGWLIGLEGIVIPMLARAVKFFDTIRHGLLTTNIAALSSVLAPTAEARKAAPQINAGGGVATAVNAGGVAALVILIWIAACIVISLITFKRQNIS